ncbi:hypothetical protein K7432_017140 [Basidiobolus ranarum]|uniref:Uncharacterized protein n=1 Tax=Basidiobolus ranarum TaxID=34480 RepID=A0ABR2VL00_9FUNG
MPPLGVNWNFSLSNIPVKDAYFPAKIGDFNSPATYAKACWISSWPSNPIAKRNVGV